MADFGKRQQENAQLSSYPTCQKINLVSADLDSISLENLLGGAWDVFLELAVESWGYATGMSLLGHVLYIFSFFWRSELSVLLILDFLLRI